MQFNLGEITMNSNDKTKTFTFHNRGTVDSFNPDKRVPDPFNASKQISQLKANKMIVETMNCPDVYILDNQGNEVK